MNYKRLHKQLIERARSEKRSKGPDVYYEEHHIKPRCLGGSEDESNKVLLTAREHFLIHWILTRIYPKNFSLIYALNMFAQSCSKNKGGRSRLYEYARRKYIWALKNNEERKQKNSITVSSMTWLRKGDDCIRVRPEELAAKLAEGYKRGRPYFVRGPHSAETIQKMSAGNTGKKKSRKARRAISKRNKQKRWISKDGDSKFVNNKDVPKFLKQGWTRSRTNYDGKYTNA